EHVARARVEIAERREARPHVERDRRDRRRMLAVLDARSTPEIDRLEHVLRADLERRVGMRDEHARGVVVTDLLLLAVRRRHGFTLAFREETARILALRWSRARPA